MGSITSAIYDDEREWEQEKKNMGIPEVPWSPYSRETHVAKTTWKQLGFYGARLRLHVKHTIQLEDLIKAQQKELEMFEKMFN